ncbi:hypothetical protein SPRG_06841 [Saprolegnia parasitica CBS 223.65]|uniref:Uncharacterized protein n=1 Tax=Saprolegnia parasitica (strain CBS 223.65) TaxID=695850 RepID=A0A067CAP7_SAPPC|nr:hypothetical protein SPRG_06841 [Saprolegnia parasitica CBS 223.65]KDO27573.1 hypothetical protein SPRG_06841 [Saprolegnia parasitica CBS 223.65]|eukprot:XP_012201698.1 hypothetical protein SPRG_06841 [Saprolegnia parasitica CBS 223.65]
MSSSVVASSELQAAIEPEPEHIDSKEQVVVVAENANNAEAIAPVNESPKLPVVDVIPVQPNEESSSEPETVPVLPITPTTPGSRPSSAPTARAPAATPAAAPAAKDTSEIPSTTSQRKRSITAADPARAPLEIKPLSDNRRKASAPNASPAETTIQAVDSVLLTEEERLDAIEAFLRTKIQNQGPSTQKEIRDFIFGRLSSLQIRTCMPLMMERLQTELGETLTLDVQTSLCVINELVLELGRASPLAGMYTDEEEALLDTLEHRTVL